MIFIITSLLVANKRSTYIKGDNPITLVEGYENVYT